MAGLVLMFELFEKVIVIARVLEKSSWSYEVYSQLESQQKGIKLSQVNTAGCWTVSRLILAGRINIER